VHDRRIDGETQVFGNAGTLYMNAMTWYDHGTQSIWSQPWGRAIEGSLEGIQLTVLPSQVTTWKSWRAEHPDTLALANGVGNMEPASKQRFRTDFVIGLILDNQTKAYYFKEAEAAGVINDRVGDIPVVVWAAGDNFHAYVSQIGDRTLTFRAQGETLIDEETGSTWDIGQGRAVQGPLKGKVLRSVPRSTAYDWAWQDFYPESEFYTP
jgi:hypothetical protein